MCIIGDVGSGKSSLLSALIGDLMFMPAGQLDQLKDMIVSDERTIEQVRTQPEIHPENTPIAIS